MNDNNPMPQGGEAKKKTSNLIIGILVVIVLILLFSWRGSDQASAPSTQYDDDDVTQDTDDTVDDGDTNLSSMSTDGILPQDWDLLKRAEAGINTLTSGQQIQSWIVADPTDENVVYFAANSFDDGDGLMQIGIYKYRTDNYNFERLFRHSYDEGDIEDLPATQYPEFHVIGYNDNQLVLLIQPEGYLPGPCTNPLLISETTERLLWSMNIEDPYSGFVEYTPSQEELAAAQSEVDACLAELNE